MSAAVAPPIARASLPQHPWPKIDGQRCDLFLSFFFLCFLAPRRGRKLWPAQLIVITQTENNFFLEFLSQFFDTLSSFGVGFLPPVFLQFWQFTTKILSIEHYLGWFVNGYYITKPRKKTLLHNQVLPKLHIMTVLCVSSLSSIAYSSRTKSNSMCLYYIPLEEPARFDDLLLHIWYFFPQNVCKKSLQF